MDHVDRILQQWNHERPDLDVAPMGLIGRVKRLQHHLSRAMAVTFARHGLNASSFDVLATLRRSGEPFRLSPGELIASTMVTSGTMTHRIDQLVDGGYVERLRSPQDRRSVLVSLTEEGFAVIDAAVTDHVHNQAKLTASLSKSDFEQLDRLLATYLDGLDRPSGG